MLPRSWAAGSSTRTRATGTIEILILVNIAAWLLAFAVFGSHPVLLGTALLAYTFGLRHAVDADHISAIDNVTRRLMQSGAKPVGVGLFFSLGHSTVVFVLTAALGIAAAAVKAHLPELQAVGAAVGTGISALFLYAIAAINLVVLAEVYQTFRRVRRGEPYDETDLDGFLAQRGLLGRVFRPVMRLVTASWHMYAIGLLFGLGFDTATEVGLLGIASIEAGNGLPIVAIMIFPLLFAAGMSLLDTVDGILMLGAYGWAFLKPVRKLYYNLTITAVSALVAVAVGSIEVLGVIAGRLHVRGPFWDAVATATDNFGFLGFAIVGLFVASWLVSIAIYRWRRYDDIEVVVHAPPGRPIKTTM